MEKIAYIKEINKRVANKELWIAARERLIEQLCEKNNWTEEQAEQYLDSGNNYELIDNKAADMLGSQIDATRISVRDNDILIKKSYMGQGPSHVPNPYPTSIVNPSADESGAYNELSDSDTCPECKSPIKKIFDPKTEKYYCYCDQCKARFSLKSFNHGYSHYGMQPGTLNNDSGSNVNNEQDHPNYHGPVVRDSFSGNLGKN